MMYAVVAVNDIDIVSYIVGSYIVDLDDNDGPS
jgi:hypothetical protein